MIEDIALSRRIASMASEVCIALFDAYGVEVNPTADTWRNPDQRMLSGIIGFVGDGIRGSCMLAGHDGPILQSCPTGGSSRDWIGELTNQLAGRLKAKLLRFGVEVALSTPIALSGVSVHPLPRNSLEPVYFACPAGMLLVWVEVDAEPEFSLDQAAVQPACHEGDIVLF